MKKTALSTFDRLMTAATFAEEGEFATAREILRETDRKDTRLTDRPEMRQKPSLRKSH
ncbi:MAG: hypothetical protein OHK006_01550 [Thermodesulfovibrionales bacterium]